MIPSLLALIVTAGISAEPISRYNVVWESASKDASGQMPLGNGDIAAGVYAIEDGDLFLLLSKNDAYTYNGDIFKTGRVRVSLRGPVVNPPVGRADPLDRFFGHMLVGGEQVVLQY